MFSQSLPLIGNQTSREEIGECSVEGEESHEEEIIKDESTVVEDGGMKVQQSFREFLREKGLSAELIRSLINTGLTDEFIRLLKALGLVEEDINRLQELWQIDLERKTDSTTSTTSLPDKNLSLDGIYLKNTVAKPLIDALKEIVERKPFDPIEYLGHRLLHYKVCEERRMRQREMELELLEERERIKMQKRDEEPTAETSESGGEESAMDWNFLNYDSL